MNELTITCENIKDRIRESKLAEKRGWCQPCYGYDGHSFYVHYLHNKKFKKKRSKSKEKEVKALNAENRRKYKFR